MDANHYKTPPIGVPFGYCLEVTTHACGSCGNTTVSSHLIEVARAGYGHKTNYMGLSSLVWDRPIQKVTRNVGTPCCEKCVDFVRKLPVKYPEPGAVVGRSAAMKLAQAAPSKTAKLAAHIYLTEITDDFG